MAHRSGAASTGPEQPPGTNSYYFSVAAVGTERRWLDDPCCVETLGEMGIPKSQGRSALALQSITSTLPRPATAASACFVAGRTTSRITCHCFGDAAGRPRSSGRSDRRRRHGARRSPLKGDAHQNVGGPGSREVTHDPGPDALRDAQIIFHPLHPRLR